MTAVTLDTLSHTFLNMASLRFSLSRSCLKLQQHRHSFRGLSSTVTAQDAANLPLTGIRVLDMTRVLAGVSVTYLCWHLGG